MNWLVAVLSVAALGALVALGLCASVLISLRRMKNEDDLNKHGRKGNSRKHRDGPSKAN